MALVRKYQNAPGPLPEQGTTPITLGKFTMNGKSLSGKLALERLAAAYKASSDSPKDMYQMAVKAINDGNEVIYDPVVNTISVLNGENKNVTSQYLDGKITASPKDSEFKKNWGATFNTRNHRFKVSGRPMATVDMDTRKELRRGSGWLYDSSGTYDASLLGKDREDVISTLLNYAADSRDVDELYKYSNWKVADREQLRNLGNELNSYTGGVSKYVADFLDRIRGGEANLREGDIQLLNLMGFTKPKEASQTQAAEIRGLDDGVETPIILDGINGGAEDGQDQNSPIKKSEDPAGAAPTDYSKGIWYLENLEGVDPAYAKGWAIDGKYYNWEDLKDNEELLSKIANQVNAAKTAKNYKEYYDLINESGVRTFDDRLFAGKGEDYYGGYSNYDSSMYSPAFSDYFNEQKIPWAGVKDITPWFTDTNGKQIITYISPKYTGSNRIMSPQFAVRYEDGTYSAPYNSLEALEKAVNLTVDPVSTFRKTAFPTTSWENGFAVHATLPSYGKENYTIVRLKDGRYGMVMGNKLVKTVLEGKLPFLFELIKSGKTVTNKDIDNLFGGGRGNYVPYQKDGGTINTATKVVGATLDAEKSKTEGSALDKRGKEYSTYHNMDNSDGGLTKAEQLQVNGAIADLVGVVSSFAGAAGGVAGIGAGLYGDVSRFRGDMMQKKKSTWESIKDLGIGVAFDLASLPASLVPGLDNALKASKFVRVIKGIGTPLLKYMGTIGCGQALTNTAAKIINGEKFTSEDVILLANGLAGGIVSGKQWSKQIGDAKLAALGSARAAARAEANAITELSTQVGDKTFKMKVDDLASIVTETKGNKNKVIDKIIAKANASEISMTRDQAEESLLKFNLFSKGGNRFRAAKVEFENPNVKTEESSAFDYFMHPLKRNRALGNLKGNKKQGNVVKEFTKEDYQNALFDEAGNPLRTWDYTASGAMRRLGARNPGAFGFNLGESTVLYKQPWQFGWKGTVRPIVRPAAATPEVVTPSVITPAAATPAATPILRLTSGEPVFLLPRRTVAPTTKIPSRGFIIGWESLDAANKNLNRVKNRFTNPIFRNEDLRYERALWQMQNYGRTFSLRLPKWDGTINVKIPGRGRYNIGAYSARMAEYRRAYPELFSKPANSPVKGSKKNQGTIGTPAPSKPNTLAQLEELGKDPSFREMVNADPKAARELVATLRQQFSNAKFKNKSTAEKDAYFNKRVNEMKVKYDWRFKEGGKIPKYKNVFGKIGSFFLNLDKSEALNDNNPGGNEGKEKPLNLSSLANLGSALIQNRDISRSYDYLREANNELKKRQFITPQYQLPTYDASVITQKYNQAKQPLLNTKFAYSDPTMAMAGKLAVSEQLSNLAMQEGTEIANYNTEFNNARLNALNNIASANAQTANEKSNYLTQLNAADSSLKAKELNEKWSSIWNTYSKEQRDKLASTEKAVNTALSNIDSAKASEEYQNTLKVGPLKALYDQYNADDTNSLNFSDWVSSSPARFSEYNKALETEQAKNALKNYRQKTLEIIKTYGAKQGGKVPEKKVNQKEALSKILFNEEKWK